MNDILQPYLTDEIKTLAAERIINGGNLANRKGLKRGDLKLILLLVREANPLEQFHREELSLLLGINKETLTKLNGEKRFVQVINH
jgi:DNA-binding Xre family transcriptional regulator